MTVEDAIASAVVRQMRDLVRAEVREALAEVRPVSNGDYLTPEEAAEIARVHPDTIRKLLKKGTLPKHRFGHRDRVLRADLDRYLAGAESEGEGPSVDAIVARAAAKRRGGP